MSVRSRSLATSTGIRRGHRLAVGAGRAARVPGVDQPHAGVREFGDLLDRDAALLGEQPYVVEVGARPALGQDLPGHPAQQHPGGLADARLDEVHVVDAVLLADPLDGRPALPGRGAVARPAAPWPRRRRRRRPREAGGDGVQEVAPRRRRRRVRGRTSRRGSRAGRPGRRAAPCARSGPETVELRQAEGMRKSSRVPYVRTQRARVGEHRDLRVEAGDAVGRLELPIASASSRVMAPLPVQPSTNTTSAGSWWAASQRSALASMPRPRTMETA